MRQKQKGFSKHNGNYGLFLLLLLVLTQYPVLKFVNRINPFVLGLPFLFFYVLGVCILMALWLALMRH